MGQRAKSEGKNHEEKLFSSCTFRHALCALLVRRGPAADESFADRVSISARSNS
jgi:hypothetical protein